MHTVTVSIIQEVKIKILCLHLILIEFNAHFKERHILLETIFQELRPQRVHLLSGELLWAIGWTIEYTAPKILIPSDCKPS